MSKLIQETEIYRRKIARAKRIKRIRRRKKIDFFFRKNVYFLCILFFIFIFVLLFIINRDKNLINQQQQNLRVSYILIEKLGNSNMMEINLKLVEQIDSLNTINEIFYLMNQKSQNELNELKEIVKQDSIKYERSRWYIQENSR
jgi:preprotein translocase subunit SecG